MIETLLPFLNSAILVVVGAGVGYFFNRLSRRQDSRMASENRLQARVSELERQNSLVTQAIVPISAAFQAILIKELTHFHTPRMDMLLAKVGPPNELSTDEEDELRVLLIHREQDMSNEITDSERDAARMLPMVIRRARIESSMPPEDSVLKVVSVLPGIIEPPPKEGV
jgi:hypothetical protein